MAGLIEKVKSEKPAMRRARDRLPPAKWRTLRSELVAIGKQRSRPSWRRLSELVEQTYGVRFDPVTIRAIAEGRRE